MSWKNDAEELRRRQEMARQMGGEFARQAQAVTATQLGPKYRLMRP